MLGRLPGNSRQPMISRVGVTGGRVVVEDSDTDNTVGFVYVGGLVGEVNESTSVITNSYSRSNVAANLAAQEIFVGGLVGEAGVGDITNSYATGNVTTIGASTDHQIGGLAGNNTPASSMITASYYSNSGTIMGGTDTVVSTLGEARSVAQLQCPASQTVPVGGFTCETGPTYVGWDPMIWNFGTATQLPVLINEDIPGQR